MNKIRLGDDLLVLAMLAWLAISVGPWQLGMGLFLGAWILNAVWDLWRTTR